MVCEIAVSLNFKKYSDKPGVVVDFRTKQEYAEDALDTKILVYEDRVVGWFFGYGRLLQNHHDAGFVVLQVALAQVEGMEQYRRGESSDRDSSRFFRDGLKRIFSLDDSADGWLRDFYTLVRCGLFHDGMIRKRVKIENRFDSPLDYDGTDIFISPNKFLDAVIEDFNRYIVKLKDQNNIDLREPFRRKHDSEA
jgi:hypothetical protein